MKLLHGDFRKRVKKLNNNRGSLKVERKKDNVQSFGGRWNETVIAMTKKPHNEVLEHLYLRQLHKALSLRCTCKDTVRKGRTGTPCKIEKREQKTRGNFCLLRDRLGDTSHIS